MKIVVIILCAFLLKAEVVAQTWWDISPKNMAPINHMLNGKTSEGQQFILVYNDTVGYSLINEKYWQYGQAYHETCYDSNFPVPYDVKFNIGNIFEGENGEWFQTYYGYMCGSTDAGIAFVNSHIPEYTIEGYIGDKILGAFSNSTNETYFFVKTWGRTYLTGLTKTGITIDGLAPITIDNYKSYDISELLVIDSRTPDIFTSVYKDTVTYQNSSISSKLEILYKKNIQDTNWKIIGSVPVHKGNSYYTYEGGFNDFYFPNQDSGIIFMATGQGLWRYNESTNQIDTLLKIPTRSIFFKEDSDIAYAGTESGEIYRSTDAGETWSLFASGFFTKPVIGIYASGNDSLIVGTEDGIWANYVLPVSVADETPFKNDELTITPNPANTSLKISFLKTDLPQQLSIYNSLGQLVFQTEFSGEFVWDFKNDMPDGVYTVAVQSGGESLVKQIIILR